MASMRFSEAGVLASERGTWNDNDIALLVPKDLEREKALGIRLGLADSESSLNTVDASYKQHPEKFDNPFECFHAYIAMDLVPPPEILICVNKCIGEYLKLGGKISLDQAFFRDVHKVKTSYSKQKFDEGFNSKYALFRRWIEVRKNKTEAVGESLYKSAERYLLEVHEDRVSDIDNFLKGFKRWKARKSR